MSLYPYLREPQEIVADVQSGNDSPNLFNYPNSAQSSTDFGWLSRVFDPMTTEMAFNKEQANIDRMFSAEQARLQREFEREMSNTAYQRAVEDMKKAGLNPYSLYGSSSGFDVATTPQGATAQGSKASIGSHANGLFNLLNSALSIAKLSMLKRL